jgi:tetratricopeptide (TPR) repeat protein
MQILAFSARAALLAGSLALVVTGCAHPHSGKPERLRAPKAKKVPPDEEEAEQADAAQVSADPPCRTNFFGEPRRGRRNPREARNLANATNPVLLEAEQTEGQKRLALVLDAMARLRNALDRDPYAPEPTYKYAVAYALAGRKSCSLAFLERLKQLSQFPDVEAETNRVIQRALRDPAFAEFRREAENALGH